MASLSKISNSLVSATNENTLALANLNFDFSIVKVQAPKEYTDLGHALGVIRRKSAENGTDHRTARKLGALFEALMPSTPKLIAAYGTRCGEIIQTPGANPSGTTERHGCFAGFVGADATTIWAAATSGATAIATHLLACLLARSFNDPAHATSVWAELVAERQREILSTASDDSTLNLTQIAALNAANQEISRQDLRRWDASVRAWLQTADLAKKREYTQLQLILKNITLPVTGGSNLYRDVIHAWKQAMKGMESLLSGQPQSVTDGGIILAISSWHVFPNLIVLGPQTTNVNFNDSLMLPESLLTLGITNQGKALEEKLGIYWSIPLSHYRYYGKPVKAEGEMGDRLTMNELHLVALGSLLRHWKTPRCQIELSARWFVSLWRRLGTTSLRPLRWLEILTKASNRLLSSDEQVKKNATRLADFGYRRGRNFLFRPSQRDMGLPWFGLRSRHILRSLCCRDATACAVEYMRCMAEVGELGPFQAMIAHITPDLRNPERKLEKHEYYTAVGIPIFPPNTENVDRIDAIPELEKDIYKGKSLSTETPLSPLFESPRQQDRSTRSRFQIRPSYNSTKESYLEERHLAWKCSFDIIDDNFAEELESRKLKDKKILEPRAQSTTNERIFSENVLRKLRCYDISPPKELVCDCDAFMQNDIDWFLSKTVQFRKCVTDSLGRIRMYITTFSDTNLGQDNKNTITTHKPLQGTSASQVQFEAAVARLRRGAWDPYVSLEDTISIFDDMPNSREFGSINAYLLWQFLEELDSLDVNSLMKPALEFMHVERKMVGFDTKPFRDLVRAQDIYKNLDGATISSAIVEHGIHSAKWCSGNHDGRDKKSVAFSCVAMMETGMVNIDGCKLDEVFALSYGNSIYVSSRLLTDPSIEVPDDALTRITGNVGRPGLSLLIPPPSSALVRPLSTDYRAVCYEVFDGQRQDNFKGTSLHMSFTSHEFPIDYGVSHLSGSGSGTT
ncbi:hypothetical protein F5Y03DRAFT_374808 [Xylaria venustula]|nr:hypothetical protein F5Y03DRAFT_374808 [Xylaria venustula]